MHMHIWVSLSLSLSLSLFCSLSLPLSYDDSKQQEALRLSLSFSLSLFLSLSFPFSLIFFLHLFLYRSFSLSIYLIFAQIALPCLCKHMSSDFDGHLLSRKLFVHQQNIQHIGIPCHGVIPNIGIVEVAELDDPPLLPRVPVDLVHHRGYNLPDGPVESVGDLGLLGPARAGTVQAMAVNEVPGPVGIGQVVKGQSCRLFVSSFTLINFRPRPLFTQ